MQNDSYDIPGFKFGLAIPKEEIVFFDDDSYMTDFLFKLNHNRVFFVPFENFDGLTVEETLKTIRGDGITFACYSEYDNPSTKAKDIYVHYNLTFLPSFLKDLGLRRLDKLIELELGNILKNKYSPYTSTRIAMCFLQRYMYGSFEETRAKIMKLNPVDEKKS